MRYSNRWKIRTLKACGLPHGVNRSVLQTLMMFGDWKGRFHRPHRELAELAGVSKISCVRALRFLVEKGFIEEISKGKGRCPSRFQVVDCETEPETVVVSPDDTTNFERSGIIEERIYSEDFGELVREWNDYDQAPRKPSGSRP